MWGNGKRKFSTIRKRLSFVSLSGKDEDFLNSKEKKALKNKLKTRTKASKSTATNHSSDMSLEQIVVDFPVEDSASKSKTQVSKSSIEFEEMPSPEEIDKLLQKTLEDLAIPEAGRAKFIEKSVEEKWKVIKAHLKYNPHSNVGQKNDVKSPRFWITKMAQIDRKGRPVLDSKEALKMQSVFRTAHKEFLTDFLQCKGVSYLNKLTDRLSCQVRRSKKDNEVLESLIECYRLLMNTELGMKGVLLVPGSVNSMAMCMDFIGFNISLTEKVVLLLSVLCWWDEEGRLKVMQAMRHLKKRFMEISTFQTLVYLFEHSEEITFKANVATFITTVCNTPPDIEQRVGVRNYFFRLDVINVFQKVLAKAPEVKNVATLSDDDGLEAQDSPWNTVQTQYEVFVAMMRQDQEEIVHKLIAAAEGDASHFDLSNLQDSWKILQKNAFKADCHLELLNVVQAMFLVPTVHDLAQPIFESIAKFVYEASSMPFQLGDDGGNKNLMDRGLMDFEELGKVLKKKIEYNARMEVFAEKEGVVKRLRKLVGVMQKRLMDVASGQIPAEDALNLQEDLIKNHLLNPTKRKNIAAAKNKLKKNEMLATVPILAAPGASSGQQDAAVSISFLSGLGLMDTAGEVEIMKQKEERYKKEIDELQKQLKNAGKPGSGGGAGAGGKKDSGALKVDPKIKLDSTGLQPAGIAPGKTKKDPPAVPRPNMPGSLENAPVPFDTAPTPAGDAAVGKKMTLKPGGANKEGGVAALFGAIAAKPKPRNNKKEKYKAALEKLGLPDKPAVQPGVKMTQIFWKVIAPDALEGTVWPELSDQKVQFDTTMLEDMFGKKEDALKVKKKRGRETKIADEAVKLVDSQRRQNLQIVLRKIKLDYSKVYSALCEVDLNVVTKDNIQLFQESVPSMDEMTLLQKFSKENGEPDKLANEERFLFEVSTIPGLATRLKCIKTFYTFANDARRIHNVVLRMNAALKEVNSSTNLRQLLEVVLAVGNFMNGGTTRGGAWGFKLDILTNLINVKSSNNNGTLMHFLFALFERHHPNLCEFSLPGSADVVDINFKETAKDMNLLAKNLAVLKQEIKKKPFAKQDKFRKVLSPFEVKASRDVEKLQQMLEKARTDFHNLAAKFAEDGNDCEPCTFFPKLVTFEQDLKRAGSQMIEMREQEEKRKIQEAKKQERLAYRKLKLLVEKTKDENGDINLGLVEAYKRSQQGKANHIVDRFLDKYNREKKRKRI